MKTLDDAGSLPEPPSPAPAYSPSVTALAFPWSASPCRPAWSLLSIAGFQGAASPLPASPPLGPAAPSLLTLSSVCKDALGVEGARSLLGNISCLWPRPGRSFQSSPGSLKPCPPASENKGGTSPRGRCPQAAGVACYAAACNRNVHGGSPQRACPAGQRGSNVSHFSVYFLNFIYLF